MRPYFILGRLKRFERLRCTIDSANLGGENLQFSAKREQYSASPDWPYACTEWFQEMLFLPELASARFAELTQ